MPVTITACANSTPASGTIIATTQVNSQEYQHFILTDSAGSALGQVSTSPFYARVTNMAASIAMTNPTGSVLVTNIPASMALTNPTGSVLINNPTGSMLVTNIPASIAMTNPTGSMLVTNMAASILVTNLTGSAAGSPLFVSVPNQISASISNTLSASIVGVSGSPLPVVSQNGTIWIAGSYLPVSNVQFSASGAAASTVVIPGVGGFKVRLLSVTYTVSASIAVSWRSGSTGGVDLIQPMYFGTHGGMDVNRQPHGYVAEWASGCAATIFLSAAASCRGFGDYVSVPG